MEQVRLRSKIDRLLARIPDLGDILRGSLIHRKTFHSKGCAQCDGGEGHPQWVLNINYPGVRTVRLACAAINCARSAAGSETFISLRRRWNPFANSIGFLYARMMSGATSGD